MRDQKPAAEKDSGEGRLALSVKHDAYDAETVLEPALVESLAEDLA